MIRQLWIDAKEGKNATICVISSNGVPFKRRIGNATRMQAKFTALIEALKLLKSDGWTKANIYTDERYIVRNMTLPIPINKDIPSHVVLINNALSLYRPMKNCKVKLASKDEIKKHTGM